MGKGWKSYPQHAPSYCEECHHPTYAYALVSVWCTDWVGSWHSWACDRCVVSLLRDRDVFVEVLGLGAPYRAGRAA